jgi:zinc/manganese transport system permease protein
MNPIIFLIPALLACLILTGIHTYLGIHVITRGVIFVDIALAQIAAFGMTFAFLFGFEPHSQAAYFFALGATIIGAIFFAYFRDDKVPQEAIIGVSFAVSSALGILVADRLPHGMEHLKYVLSGDILWVTWHQLIKTAIIYSLLGLFHYFLRRKFLLVSSNPEEASRRGMKIWFWDLLFYLSFGLVITSSVQMAGILLVFSYLIVPACCATLFYEGLRQKVFFGWAIGIFTSVIGISISYLYDLPTGPAIVTAFGIALLVSFILKYFIRGQALKVLTARKEVR